MLRRFSRFQVHACSVRPILRPLIGMALVALPLSILVTTTQSHAQTDNSASSANSQNAVTAPLSVDWKYTATPAPNNPASPVVSGDSVYFASGAKVYALSLHTGALKWTYPADGFMASAVQGTPTLSGNTLFIPAGDGLYALNTADGKLKYPAFKLTQGGVTTTPAVLGNTVYFASASGRIYAINADTGDPMSSTWRAGLNVGTDLAGDMSTANGVLYFLTSNGYLHAIDAASGIQKWGKQIEGNVDGAIPVSGGEFLYVATGQLLTSWRATTGQPMWSMPTRNEITAPPAVDADGIVYIATAANGIYAVDWRTRNHLLWKRPAQVDYEVRAQPIVAGNVLIVGTTAGGVYAFDKATGGLKWNYAIRPTSLDPTRVPTTNRVSDAPVVANDRLFVLTDDGSLTSFRHDAPDTLPPDVTELAPEQGEYCNGRPPFTIHAHIIDDGSGLDSDAITLKLDDQMIPRRASVREAADKPGFIFNKDTGNLDYITVESETGRSHTLSDGHHTATIVARDWKGNVETKTWTFTIDDTLGPEKYQVASANTGQNRSGRPGFPGGQSGGPGLGGGKGGGGNSGGGGGEGGGDGGGE